MRGLITTLAILLGLAVAAAVFYSAVDPQTQVTDTDADVADAVSPADPDADASAPIDPAVRDPRSIIPDSNRATDDSDQTATQPAPAPAEPTPPDAPVATQPAPDAPAPTAATSTDTTDSTEDSDPATPASTPTAAPLTAQAPDRVQPAVIGSNDPVGPFKLRVELSAYGAAVKQVTLTDYMTEVDGDEPYPVIVPLTDGNPVQPTTVYSFAAWKLVVNGSAINLLDKPFALVRQTPGSATYALTVLSGGVPTARVVRTYRLGEALYDIDVKQHVENLTDQPITIAWQQLAQGDIPNDGAEYLGDQRRVAMGYFDLDYDKSPNGTPLRRFVYTEDTFTGRPSLLSRVADSGQPVWPISGVTQSAEFVWVATVNRYFAVAIHPPVIENPSAGEGQPRQRITPWFSEDQGHYAKLGTYVFGREGEGSVDERVLLFTLTSRALTIPPQGKTDLGFSIFAGPRDDDILKEQPYKLLNFPNLIIYNLGGMCAVCTFQWLAKGLLGFLEILHDYIVFDWGVAIIFLVIVVRLILHPITKKSQVNMMKMGKQMSALQPEVEKLKKKYKDDQSTLNTEMMKLYREKGVNPANMLGCAPMFLQMPIWIALYAMLYFAIELRHEAGFYGIFQLVSGGNWAFFQDLAQPDNFIKVFDVPKQINLIFIHPNFQSINIIPLLMAVVFYFQQKLMTPPAANEQQAQQQKIMKFMVFLFPVFLYSAPSGLTLYILASTGAGIVDSYIVRKHVKEQEESGELFKKKERKPGGFMDRLQKAAEQRQKEVTERRKKVDNTAGPKKRKRK